MSTLPPATDPRSKAGFERTYGFPRMWITALNVFAVVFVLASGWFLALYDTFRVTARILTSEHGPVELLSFASFLAAAIRSAAIARQAARRRETRLVVMSYTVFAALSFLAAMEEISWGQALFNFQTPFGLSKVNEQGELNLHDMPGVMELNSAVLFLFGIAGLIGIRLGKLPGLRKIGIPPALRPLFAWIAVMGALEVASDLVYIQFSFDIILGVLAEAVEMLMGFACLAYVWMNGRMLQREWEAGG